MRYSIAISAAFAATAFASPMKRELIVETDTATDIDYVTDIITVTAGQPLPSSAAAPVVTSSAAAGNTYTHWGHHHHHSSASASAVTSTVVAAPSSSAPVESSTVVVSSYSAPAESSSEAPAPTSYSAPAYSAPAPTSSSVAAPSSAPASSAPQSSSSATATASGSASVATTYTEVVVNQHNYHRTNHSATELVWNSTLASIAAQIASSCNYGHNVQAGGGGYGQNIAARGDTQIGAVITDQFYNSEMENYAGLYGQANPDMSNFENWGHFSQIVWKGTDSVGCATQYCPKGTLVNAEDLEYFTVCNYGPPGNYAGEYGDNIGQPLGNANIVGTYQNNYNEPTGTSVSS